MRYALFLCALVALVPTTGHALDFTVLPETPATPSDIPVAPHDYTRHAVVVRSAEPNKLVQVRLESGFFYLFRGRPDYTMSYSMKPSRDERDPLGRTDKQLIRLRVTIKNQNKSFLF